MPPRKRSKKAKRPTHSSKSPKGSGWTIEFTEVVAGELDLLPKVERERILTFLFDRVAQLENPKKLGRPLSEQFAGYWRYRIGSYRIVCDMRDSVLTVLVVRIGQRSEVYRYPLG